MRSSRSREDASSLPGPSSGLSWDDCQPEQHLHVSFLQLRLLCPRSSRVLKDTSPVPTQVLSWDMFCQVIPLVSPDLLRPVWPSPAEPPEEALLVQSSGLSWDGCRPDQLLLVSLTSYGLFAPTIQQGCWMMDHHCRCQAQACAVYCNCHLSEQPSQSSFEMMPAHFAVKSLRSACTNLMAIITLETATR